MVNRAMSDIVSTINISKSEYEDLVRDSNTLRIIENLVAASAGSINAQLIKNMLGLYIDESEDIEDGSK